MIGVDEREWVDGVRAVVTGRGAEKRVHRVENLARYDQVPLAQDAAGILAVLAVENNVEPRPELARRASVEFAERVLEQMIASHSDCHVIAS